MNILIIDKSIEGGTGSFILNFLKIKRIIKNVKITVLVLEKPSLRSVDNQNFVYFRHKNFYPKKYSPTLKNLLSFFEELFWLKNKIKLYDPDIIMGIDLRSNFLAIINKILFFKKIKVIATTHIFGTVFDGSVYFLIVRKLLRLLYKQADVLVCSSKQLASSMKKIFDLPKTPMTIYYGLNFSNSKPKILKVNKKQIIISVARLSDQKDHLNLIRSFSLLKQKLPLAELWLLGDGPEKKKLEYYVKSNGLEEDVRFLGWVEDVRKYLLRSDLFALSSKKEGFAYVLIEAMSCGLPIVSTDTPYGPREVLANGKYGLLVPMSDPNAMRVAILDLMKNKKMYNFFSRKSYERSRYFSIDNMITSYKKIMLEMYENRN